MIKRKYVVLLLLTLVSISLTGLLYSNLAQANPTVTGYVSVPAAAFVAEDSANTYTNYYGQVIISEDVSGGMFTASTQLPDGATVTNVTSYWFDGGAEKVTLELRRSELATHTVNVMANMESSGAAGYGSSYNDTVAYATVDYSQYAYYLLVDITGQSNYGFYYALIEYTLPSEAVGGFWIPVDKFSLLAPYIISTITIILVASISVAYIKYRRKE